MLKENPKGNNYKIDIKILVRILLMPYGYIYKISFPNNKIYIGLTTTSIEQRHKEHKSCALGKSTCLIYI